MLRAAYSAPAAVMSDLKRSLKKMRYQFRPDPKRSGRNQVLGSWSESRCREIDLQMTVASLRELLEDGRMPAGTYTHQEIAAWCDRLHMLYLDDDSTREMDAAVSVAADVDCQWDLFLANSYPLEELQTMDFSQVRLPDTWFADWLAQLNSEQDAPSNGG